MSKQVSSNLLLLLMSMIWGAAFVAQSVGMDYVEPYTFLAGRNVLACLTVLPVILFRRYKAIAPPPKTASEKKLLALAGLCCGICLFGGSALQMLGLQYTTVAKCGFLSATYIIFIPLIALFLGRKPSFQVWISVLLALAGLYLLCGGSFSMGLGELLTLASALCYAFHILCVDYFSTRVDGFRLSFLQFFMVAVLSGLCAAFTETPTVSGLLQGWLPICYAGILSSGVGYTLQIIAQAHTEPTIASLIMSLESVFSLLFGWLLLHQTLSTLELLGCALVFLAILLIQIPFKRTAPSITPDC